MITLNEEAKQKQGVTFNEVAIPYNDEVSKKVAWCTVPRIELSEGQVQFITLTVECQNGALRIS